MSSLAQNLIALLLVAASVGYVGWQLVRSIQFGKGKAGSCCGKGCAAQEAEALAHSQAKPKDGLQFISSDALRRKR